ncbi:hypothetical protein, partial [Duncaniella muris]|uniref:hypothetical protein n=4 Tax=Duncaniella muris TaxID=2094150 RepID=UPI0026023024
TRDPQLGKLMLYQLSYCRIAYRVFTDAKISVFSESMKYSIPFIAPFLLFSQLFAPYSRGNDLTLQIEWIAVISVK